MQAKWTTITMPGHMWMELLEGPHMSPPTAPCWTAASSGTGMRRAFRGLAACSGTGPSTLHPCLNWTRIWRSGSPEHMPGYSGMLNFETIGGRIIEAHLRFADQWCDLYGEGWVEALIGLYADMSDGALPMTDRRDGFSVPLFALHGQSFRHPPPHVQKAVRAMPHVKSLQVTFFEDKPPEDHPMPPGGFRLGVINATDLPAAFAARQTLARAFPSDAIQHQDQASLIT
jgi:hypothetical protein